MKKLFASIVFMLVLLTACGPAGIIPQPTLEQAPLPTSISSNEWSIALKQSGGFAGVSRMVEIHSDGKIIAQDERSGKSMKRQLTADELSKINKLLKSFSYQRPATPSGCADCFIFTLEIQSGGKNISVRSDEVNLHGSGAEELIGYLASLMNAMLSSG